MTIAERLKERLKFDHVRDNYSIEYCWGANAENARLAPILARLVECVEAMENIAKVDPLFDEMPRHYKEVLADETLAALAKELE